MLSQKVISIVLITLLASGTVVCGCDALAAEVEIEAAHHAHMSHHKHDGVARSDEDCEMPCGVQASSVAQKELFAYAQSSLSGPDEPQYVAVSVVKPPQPSIRETRSGLPSHLKSKFTSDTPVRRFDLLLD